MNFFQTLNARQKLIKAFREMGLYKVIGSNERKIYPKIHAVKFDEHAKTTQFVFSLLNGLDPKEIEKKEYIFNQFFGENIKIDGDYKKFVLTVRKNGLMKELNYNYNDLSNIISDKKMPIVCGKDQNGKWVIYDAIPEPNCLISGEPGSGKSTQLRSILTTLIKYKSPNELHMYLGDLKMSEFHMFKGIDHVKGIAIFPDGLKRMLKIVYKEMISRSKLLNKCSVIHVDKLPKNKKVPYILLAIDEIVMVMDDKEIKKMIVQIDSLGRALGIYNILSLQRPSHDILDTKIRSLLTVRMGFRTTDLSNSKMIGTPGSEKISRETPGRFFLKRDSLDEIQAPYLTDFEAEKLLEPYKTSEWKNCIESQNEPLEDIVGISEDDLFNGGLKNA